MSMKMIIKDMFEKPINRNINGVIKVSEKDEESIYQELSEYVVTHELVKHFRTFFLITMHQQYLNLQVILAYGYLVFSVAVNHTF